LRRYSVITSVSQFLWQIVILPPGAKLGRN
jgi:hypothetical protein